jgi:hypothetical protein
LFVGLSFPPAGSGSPGLGRGEFRVDEFFDWAYGHLYSIGGLGGKVWLTRRRKA